MCGRYTLKSPADVIAAVFGLPETFEAPGRYNVAPTQDVPVVRAAGPGGGGGGDDRRVDRLRWGLVPSWAKDPSVGNRMINARSETVREKPSFRSAFKSRRCLVVADGFYEWKRTERQKVPFYFFRTDERPFAFAGLWEHWHQGDAALDTFTILTTEANELLEPVHDRMPVILDARAQAAWLDPRADPAALETLLVPADASGWTSHAVSTLVNSPRNDRPECVEPVGKDVEVSPEEEDEA